MYLKLSNFVKKATLPDLILPSPMLLKCLEGPLNIVGNIEFTARSEPFSHNLSSCTILLSDSSSGGVDVVVVVNVWVATTPCALN